MIRQLIFKEDIGRDLTKLNKNDVKKMLIDTLKLTLNKIRKNQDLVNVQMDMAFKKKNDQALKNLQIMELFYQAAVDIKEFDDSDSNINDWVEEIFYTIKNDYN